MADQNLHKTALKYGLILAAILMSYKTVEYTLFSYKIPLGIYLGLVVFSFLGVGTWMGLNFHAEEKLSSKSMPDKQPEIEVLPHENLLITRKKG